MITLPVWYAVGLHVFALVFFVLILLADVCQRRAVRLMQESGEQRQIYFKALMYYARSANDAVAMRALEDGMKVKIDGKEPEGVTA